MRVRHALAGAGALRASLGALLDNRHAGVIQLDRHGRIAAANDLARDLLRLGDRLSDRDGGLCIPSSAENTTLQQLLGRALPHYGDRGVSSSMVMTRPNGTPPTVLHVIPVDAERSFRSPRVAALVLIVDIDPKRLVRIEPDLVAATLGLTPAESVVAALLAEGRTIRDIARATGREEETVRWHKKHVFSKVGVSRQVDLVRLLLSLADLPRARR